MCTVLQAALASASEYVGLNALAAAGFGMLVWNPNWLGDISFQLSFVAVAAILAWGVPLCRRCRTRWKGVNVVVDAYLIGSWRLPPLRRSFRTRSASCRWPDWRSIRWPSRWPGSWCSAAHCGCSHPSDSSPRRSGSSRGAPPEGISALARLTASLPGGTADYTLGGWPTAAVYAVFALATLAAWSGEPKKNVPLRT